MDNIKLALFETVSNSASAALTNAANSVSNQYNKGGKQAILVNNVTRIATGWRIQSRINLSQFAPECVIEKAGIGDDTHAIFTFTVNDDALSTESSAVLEEYSTKLDELFILLEEGSDRFDGKTVEDVFSATGSVTLPPKAGFGYPHVIVPLYLGVKIEFVSEGKVNAYHKVTNAICPEPLQFGVNSGGVTFTDNEDDFLADFTASIPSTGSTGTKTEVAEPQTITRRTVRR